MKQRLQYIFSIVLIVSAFQVKSQDTTVLTMQPGLTVYVDYGKLLTIPFNFEMKAEAGISYRLKNRFEPNLQVGMGRLEPTAAFENGEYLSEGVYGRVGLNYLIPLDPVNTLYIGAKYAMAQFEESGSYEISSTLWQNRTESYSRTGLEATWYEFIIGSEKKLSRTRAGEAELTNWALGGYFSLRILNSRETFTPIDTYAIPGYGRSFDSTAPAFNLYIRYRF